MDREIMKFTEKELNDYINESGKKILGLGGFGSVYKGIIKGMFNGRNVAIKISRNKFAEEARDQWHAETEYLPRAEHQNIIKLIGHCEGQDKFFLVYPFMKNGTVKQKLPVLEWSKTIKIIKGVASAIQKLHGLNPPLIHRDLKLDNILLDKDFTPKLADFGRATPEGDHKVSGTKAHDIYDFGTIILQLITKKENSYFVGCNWKLRDWVRSTSQEIVDKLKKWNGCSTTAAKAITELALDCVEDEPSDRPTISQVLNKLANL